MKWNAGVRLMKCGIKCQSYIKRVSTEVLRETKVEELLDTETWWW